MDIRTRFAPSPTGSLHIGGARTALYNYLLAKKMNGKFILRIEDTDKERSTESSCEQLIAELQWLNLQWDEGPCPDKKQEKGNFGPYKQSQRFSIYQKHAQQLLKEGKAYYCFASEDEINAQKEQNKKNKAYIFQSPYRNIDLKEAQEKLKQGQSAVIRYKNTHQQETFTLNDLVRGEVNLPGNMIGDFVILRADSTPVYNFCCAIDDATMQITHVLRGEEHLPNTLRQIMLYKALKLKMPQFGHLSLILDQDQKKLSKRNNAASICDFKNLGFTSEALLNYLALLGWSDPNHREILSLEELSQAFSTDRLNPAAPMYNPEKLRWTNSQHLKKYNNKQLWQMASPFLEKAQLNIPQDTKWQEKTLEFFHQDLHTLKDITNIYKPFTIEPNELNTEAKTVLQWPKTKDLIYRWIEKIFSLNNFNLNTEPKVNDIIEKNTNADPQTLHSILNPILENEIHIKNNFMSEEEFKQWTKEMQKELLVKGKELFMPLRVAILGKPHGPELKISIQLLTQKQLIIRAIYALTYCHGSS